MALSPEKQEYLKKIFEHSLKPLIDPEWPVKFFGEDFLDSHLTNSGYGKEIVPRSTSDGVSNFYCNCGIGIFDVHNYQHEGWKEQLWWGIFTNKGVMMCSVNNSQSHHREELIKMGFEVVMDWTRNPNSGSLISVLIFRYPYKQTK